MKIPVIPFVQHGKTMYVGKISSKELSGKGQVDVWQINNTEGYQRKPEPTRAKAFMRFIAKDISPPAILVNIREKDKSKITVGNGFLEIPDTVSLWIMDGQHRCEGTKLLMESSDKDYDVEFPIILMLGEPVYEEAKQFVLINQSQKKVRTDLGERFLLRAVEQEGTRNIADKFKIRGIEWIPNAIRVTDILYKDHNSLWYNKIKLPNEPRGHTVVNQKSFTDSLKPVIHPDGELAGKNPATIASIINQFWEALHKLCPAPFEDPENYVMQRTTGVFVLHSLLEKVLRKMGKDEPDKKDFVKILENIPQLTNASIWAKNGRFGHLMGQKGFAIIKQELFEQLEKYYHRVRSPMMH